MTRCLPRRRMPSIARPSSACNGGSNVFGALMPGAIVDSISAPASASSSLRAVISTSGSSGTPPMLRSGLREAVDLARAKQHHQLAAGAVDPDAGHAALLHGDLRTREVMDDLGEVGIVADHQHALVGGQQLERVVGGDPLAQRLVLERLAAEALAGELRRLERADLGRRVDRLERDLQGGKGAAGSAGLALAAFGQVALVVAGARVVRLGLAVPQEPELTCHRRTVTSSRRPRHRDMLRRTLVLALLTIPATAHATAPMNPGGWGQLAGASVTPP